MKRFAFLLIPALLIAAIVPATLAFAGTAHAAARAGLGQSQHPGHVHTHPVLFPSRQEWAKLRKAHRGVTPYVMGSGDLQYQGGPVQHNPVTYLIFWGPTWQGSDSGAAGVIQSYFNDLGGTSFENILTQYYDYNGNVTNSEYVAGVWYDTSAAPTDGSCGGPTVQDSSIQNEVANAINANGWPTDGSNALYLVYTPAGNYINDGAGDCSAPAGGFCAYHNWSSSDGVAYAAMPYDNQDACDTASSPNGNIVGDSLANVSSHEEFETISDPQPPSGWVDYSGYEIGDKCAWDFSAGYTYLNGGTFELQTEYSDASSSCVNSY